MGMQEFLLRLMVAVKPMTAGIMAVVIITCACLPVLVVKSHGLWFDSPNFRFFSIFYNMRFYDAVRLASAFVKMVFVAVFVIQFQKLEAIHYICFAFASLLYSIDLKAIARTFSNLFWLIIQLLAVFSVNILCGYILDISMKIEFILLYVVLGIFVVLFAVYLFITEINEVSLGRRAKIETNIK